MPTQRLTWDQAGERVYETGVDRGVLYPMTEGNYGTGVAWNGLTNITESPSGAEPTKLWADNINYLTLMSAEEFGGSIEAYTYPEEWAACDGSAELAPGVMIGQQDRKSFGLCYRTKIGNDTLGDAYGYKLHLVYGAKATPSERANATVNDSPEAMTLSWEFSTTPVEVEGFKPIAHIVIDSTKIDKEKLTALEDLLYGSSTAAAKLPLPSEIKELVTAAG